MFYTYISSEEEEEGESWPFYSVGGRHDVLVPRGEATREISELLGRVVHGRTAFSFGGRAYNVPDLPGLSVKDVGHVSLPLPARDAGELMEKGEKFGENTWIVPGDQVTMKNSKWTEGVQSLAKPSAEKLGFKGVALQWKLSRLVLYGEGGRLEKQKDVDGSGRVVGTIVVQLPSKHAGGDLVVYEEGTKEKARYELGKVNGDAAFVPYYVVYAAGASWEVDPVTSGVCLMVVCSLCLPPELPSMHGMDSSGFLRVQMTQAMRKMVTGKDDEQIEDKDENVEEEGADWSDPDHSKILALMLSTSLLPKDIEEKGIDALAGDDAGRFQLMNTANGVLRCGASEMLHRLPGVLRSRALRWMGGNKSPPKRLVVHCRRKETKHGYADQVDEENRFCESRERNIERVVDERGKRVG